ncbi:MAG: hypothetical protein QXP01_05135 [Candidatus Hadarchaeum sp.]
MKTKLETRWYLAGVGAIALCIVTAVVTWKWVPVDLWWLRVFLGISALILCVYLVTLLVSLNLWQKLLETERSKLIHQAQDAGRLEGFVAIGRSLAADPNILNILWHDSVGQPILASPNDRKWLSGEILDRLMQSMRLVQLGKAGTVVMFDSSQHMPLDALQVGEPCVIVEPGWKVGNEILRSPVVRRKP